MRVLTNVWRLAATGGIEMNVLQVSRGFAKRGHRVSVVYQQGGDLASEYQTFCDHLAQVPLFETPSRRHPVRAARLLRPAVLAGRASQPDVVWAQRFRAAPWAIQVARRRVPVICHFHQFSGKKSKVLNRLLTRRIDRMLAVSDWVRDEWVAHGVSPARITTVYNGIDPDEYPIGGLKERAEARAELGLAQDAYVVLYCGRLEAAKGVEVLLRAWRQVVEARADATLLMVGSGVEAYERELVRQATGLPVMWLPRRRDVVLPMHAADVAVLPSNCDESFGRVVIEAMATGRPVVATKDGGLPEILIDRFQRFLVEKYDAQGLSETLLSLADWRMTEPALAAECRAHVERHFTIEAMLDRLEAIFTAEIARKNRVRPSSPRRG